MNTKQDNHKENRKWAHTSKSVEILKQRENLKNLKNSHRKKNNLLRDIRLFMKIDQYFCCLEKGQSAKYPSISCRYSRM